MLFSIVALLLQWWGMRVLSPQIPDMTTDRHNGCFTAYVVKCTAQRASRSWSSARSDWSVCWCVLHLPSCLHAWVFAKEARHAGGVRYHPWLILIRNQAAPEKFTWCILTKLAAPVFVRWCNRCVPRTTTWSIWFHQLKSAGVLQCRRIRSYYFPPTCLPQYVGVTISLCIYSILVSLYI